MFYQIIKAGNDEIGLVWEDAGEKRKWNVFICPAGENGQQNYPGFSRR